MIRLLANPTDRPTPTIPFNTPARRVTAHLGVALIDLSNGNDWVGTTTNLSMGGMYLTCDTQLAVGSHIFACLMAPQRDGQMVEGEFCGEVVHLFEDGMGIRFTHMSVAAWQIVHSLTATPEATHTPLQQAA